MVGFNRPSILSSRLAVQGGHQQVGGGPVFRVAVCVNGPQDLDHAITCQMQNAAVGWDGHVRNAECLTGPRTDLAIAFQARKPRPAVLTDAFQIVQAAVPAVKSDQRRSKAARMRRRQHVPEMVVFVQAIMHLVVDAIIARQAALPIIRPHQRNQVYPAHHRMVLT